MILTTIPQIILALVLVILLFALGFFVYNKDILTGLTANKNNKVTTMILEGVYDLTGTTAEKEINTIDESKPNYINMPLSNNQRSGGEFTYNFWLWMDKTVFTGNPDLGNNVPVLDDGLKADDYILFMRGIKKKYNYKNICNSSKSDVMIKSPLVKLQRKGKYLTVELNTIKSPDARKYNSRNTCNEKNASWSKMNKARIAIGDLSSSENFNQKWFMVSIVVQETFPDDPIPISNKLRIRMYINGVLELDQYLDSGSFANSSTAVLLQNAGNVYIYPKALASGVTTISGMNNTQQNSIMNSATTGSIAMANFQYSNYALTGSELETLYNKRFPLALNYAGAIDLSLQKYKDFSSPSSQKKPILSNI